MDERSGLLISQHIALAAAVKSDQGLRQLHAQCGALPLAALKIQQNHQMLHQVYFCPPRALAFFLCASARPSLEEPI